MPNQRVRVLLRLWVVPLVICVSVGVEPTPLVGQEIVYEDRIGSNNDFDVCEDHRFRRITSLVEQGTITQQQGYNIWKRAQSNKDSVSSVLGQAVEANELTPEQVERLMPLIDMEMTYFDSQHGRFGQPKLLSEGEFQPGEVNAENRHAVYLRLVAANERGEIYDYDVASIMNQLYAGFDSDSEPAEEVATYRAALNPRIAQSGSLERVLQNVLRQRTQANQERSEQGSYGAPEIQIAAPADWANNLEEPIFSGPQPNERAPSLTAINLRGEQAGQEIDPIELAADKLHLMFFVSKSRTFGRFLGQLRQQLDAIESHSDVQWAMSIIVCNDDANEVANSFAVLDGRYPENLVVGLSTDGSPGPPAYGLDRNLTATVIVVKDGRVIHNLPYVGDAFYTQPHILGAIAEAMEVDHATLRRYIGRAPGDAAGAAYRRRAADNEASPQPQQGFREKLAPLVLAERLTRAEAAELLRSFSDQEALYNKVEQLVEAGKLNRDEARELLMPIRSDDEQTSRDR